MQNKQISYLLIPLLACIWGSSFILMKRGMFAIDGQPVFTSAQVASIRNYSGTFSAKKTSFSLQLSVLGATSFQHFYLLMPNKP
jgi:hypothetical protein